MSDAPKKTKRQQLTHAEVYRVYTHLSAHKDRFEAGAAGDAVKEFEDILGRPVDPKSLRDWGVNAGVKFRVQAKFATKFTDLSLAARLNDQDAKIAALEQRVKDQGAALADAVSRLRKLEADLGVNLLKSAL